MPFKSRFVNTAPLRRNTISGADFKRRRIDLGYESAAAVARELGRHAQTILNWEKGKMPVPRYAVDWVERRESVFTSLLIDAGLILAG